MISLIVETMKNRLQALGKLLDTIWPLYIMFPLCPNGGHRLKGKLHTNINDKEFCEHPDCIKANTDDIGVVDCLNHCLKKFTCARTFGEMPCDNAREAYVRKMNSFHK